MPTFMVTAISTAYDMVNMLYRKDNCGLKWVLRRVKWKISTSSLLTAENLLPFLETPWTMTSTASIQGNTKGSTTDRRPGVSFKNQLCHSPERWPAFHELLPLKAHLINTFRDVKVKQPETNSPLRLTSSLRYHASQPILTYTRSSFVGRWGLHAQLESCSPSLVATRSTVGPSLSFETLWKQRWSMLVFS